jgi:hypothetical protein
MLRYCAIHRDTSGNWKFDRLQKFEWNEWQNATNYATENNRLREADLYIEEGVRSLIRCEHFTVHGVAFSQDGLVRLLRKTLFQRSLRGSRAMTIKFYQTPLFCLDQLKPSMFKRIHQAFLASP